MKHTAKPDRTSSRDVGWLVGQRLPAKPKIEIFPRQACAAWKGSNYKRASPANSGGALQTENRFLDDVCVCVTSDRQAWTGEAQAVQIFWKEHLFECAV